MMYIRNATHHLFLTSKKCIFVTEILSTVRLPETHNTCGIQPPGFSRTPRRHAEPKWDIRHAVDHAARMLRAVL